MESELRLESKETSKKKSGWLLYIAAGILLFSALLFLIGKFNRTGLEEKIASGKPIYFLFHALGDNEEYEFGLLATLFPANNRCALYFIHPITSFDDPDDSLDLLKSGAKSSVKSAVTDLIGAKPNYTISISAGNWIRLVDLLGGLNVYMDHKTARSSQEYNREAGVYTMSGQDVYDYTSTMEKKETLDYLDRISRQESIVLTLYETLTERKEFLTLPLLLFAHGLIETDLSKEDFLSLVKYVNSRRIQFGVGELPGEPQNDPKTKKPFLKTDIARARVAFRKFSKDMNSDVFTDAEFGRTEVLNGTEVAGLAKDVRGILSDKRIKVLAADNAWKKGFPKTVVIDRSGNTAIMDRISTVLEKAEVHHVLRKDLGMDATVVVGSDYEPRK
ncbi:LytR family transcriptional regulator [Leptospira gomenensis]|uniref:LytR family transcriptional regulator n=1 Tax=Leptospira gomenensis TaxID=2484974 RepID=A0A5F1YAK9_9LEPT|nr:LCP family protein [Leptospira gomenensis]TGK34436.1 LytR family transcriptional regulator [Leptospira gomenensis]TGK34985.1 LytR family transcriptional regulator [Leptospira gomenensis]TGK41822.1 LytR family transcriptional regulator [Leptospira gomenensis]TGK65146.1 LytR family transcriptional regulator [Leptospira gomenensis]